VTPIYTDCCGPRRLGASDSARSDAAVEIYPNPAHDLLTIELNKNIESGQHVRIEVTDMQGKLMLYQEYVSDSPIFQLDISELSAGMYIVNVRAGESCKMQKISVE
jgi:Secretion system C-terminal sorting domain